MNTEPELEDEVLYTIVLYEKSSNPYLPSKYIMTLPYRIESYKVATTLRDTLNETVGKNFVHICSFSGRTEFEDSDD